MTARKHEWFVLRARPSRREALGDAKSTEVGTFTLPRLPPDVLHEYETAKREALERQEAKGNG